MPRPGRFTPGTETGYPLYRRLSVPLGRSGRVRKISPQPGFDPRTVQPVTTTLSWPVMKFLKVKNSSHKTLHRCLKTIQHYKREWNNQTSHLLKFLKLKFHQEFHKFVKQTHLNSIFIEKHTNSSKRNHFVRSLKALYIHVLRIYTYMFRRFVFHYDNNNHIYWVKSYPLNFFSWHYLPTNPGLYLISFNITTLGYSELVI